MKFLLRNKSNLVKFITTYSILTWFTVLIFAIWVAKGINTVFIYKIGILSGQVAVILFCLTLLPGISHRFKFKSTLITLLIIVRRQLGIAMFSASFLHYSSIRLLPILFSSVSTNLNPPLFEIFGLLTLYPLFFLFITSNNFAVKSLKFWWGKIHKIIYILTWTLFFHIALQEFGIWTVILATFALMETLSLLYFYCQKSTSS
ncbi:hypothetical protein COV58_00120 [Candidatus Roizmanbacteria bacterium CG11_big_fil_rev_8_21_14_0_20_36_8]|uniref:Uncharacterized protein n=1 Tax=Candidatus Roizmanbacteria bacterium CG11_big_fil_rev_8_21_14_0_20_36_8 TaxID=1974856 RepID=A0A2M6IVK2_9BACT|nr:MAG: hypothetical protein COV58_00120 [Candidatus Roizmanbacteria bacterium CG11_big_fil_rev_8_21_14_0_20_36_8]